MKVAVIGDSLRSPSGFGGQMKVIVRGLAAGGHEVVAVTAGMYPPSDDLPDGCQEWRIANMMDLDGVDRALHTLRPDAAIVFWHTYMVHHLSKLRSVTANCPTYYWLPWEGTTLPHQAKPLFGSMPRNSVIHLSEFSRNLWGEIFQSDIVIPHGVDLEVFQYDRSWFEDPEKRKRLRREWAERLRLPLFDDSFVILNLDRNIHHKRWDATFDLVRRVQDMMPDRRVQLIAHTKVKGDMVDKNGNVQNGAGYDLEKLATLYSMEKQLLHTGFDWNKGLSVEDLVSLYRVADVRVSTSMGEGFGIPVLECAALGLPQIVNNHTCVSELLPEGSPFLVDPAMTECNRELLWQVPDVAAMAQRVIDIGVFQTPSIVTKDRCQATRDYVRSRFGADRVGKMFCDLVEGTLPNAERNGVDPWRDHRWGYTNKTLNVASLVDLARVVQLCGPRRVVDVGAFDGVFVGVSLELGLDVAGIEPDLDVVKRQHDRVRQAIRVQDYASEWPTGDAVVLTDVLDLVNEEGGQKLVNDVLAKVVSFDWAFVRLRPSYKFGASIVDAEPVREFLSNGGMTRRPDLETMGKEKFGHMSHEIWSRTDSSMIPSGLT